MTKIFRGLPKNGKEYGHYTQLIWGKTSKIGCSMNVHNKGESWDRLYMVCNYGPTGNFNGQPVYEKA